MTRPTARPPSPMTPSGASSPTTPRLGARPGLRLGRGPRPRRQDHRSHDGTTSFDAADRPTRTATTMTSTDASPPARPDARVGQPGSARARPRRWRCPPLHLHLRRPRPPAHRATAASESHPLPLRGDDARGHRDRRRRRRAGSCARWCRHPTGRSSPTARAGTDPRTYGTNAHHDVTWTPTPAAPSPPPPLRPLGHPPALMGHPPRLALPGQLVRPRTDLAYARARWYSSPLGSFMSEDTLLGAPETPAAPPSRLRRGRPGERVGPGRAG